MKKIIMIMSVLVLSTKLYAQQDPQYTMYMFNQMAVNPAYAGSRECLSATLHYRDQWTGIDGSPKTLGFGIHSPLNNEHIALGLQITNDRLGVTNNTTISGIFAYRIPVTKKSKLSIGLQATMNNYLSNLSSVNLYNINNSTADQVFNSNTQLLLPNFGAGLYWYSEKAYIGFSVPHFINNPLESKSTTAISDAAKQYRHLFAMAGYMFKLSDVVKLKPSVMLKYAPNSPVETDLNACFLFYDALWLGASWRSDVSALRDHLTESTDFMVIYEINQMLRIGLAYDLTLTKLNAYNYGTYELMVGYDFRNKMDRMLTPRYF
jgi:type IX secretion system PorP/SprF family membrane protein